MFRDQKSTSVNPKVGAKERKRPIIILVVAMQQTWRETGRNGSVGAEVLAHEPPGYDPNGTDKIMDLSQRRNLPVVLQESILP